MVKYIIILNIYLIIAIIRLHFNRIKKPRFSITMKGCRPLTDEEIDLVLASFFGKYESRDRALFLLGLKSGFRISEILSLKVKDVCRNGRMVDRVTVARGSMNRSMSTTSRCWNSCARRPRIASSPTITPRMNRVRA